MEAGLTFLSLLTQRQTWLLYRGNQPCKISVPRLTLPLLPSLYRCQVTPHHMGRARTWIQALVFILEAPESSHAQTPASVASCSHSLSAVDSILSASHWVSSLIPQPKHVRTPEFWPADSLTCCSFRLPTPWQGDSSVLIPSLPRGWGDTTLNFLWLDSPCAWFRPFVLEVSQCKTLHGFYVGQHFSKLANLCPLKWMEVFRGSFVVCDAADTILQPHRPGSTSSTATFWAAAWSKSFDLSKPQFPFSTNRKSNSLLTE